MVVDAGQHVGQPGFRGHIIQFGGADQGIEGSGALPAADPYASDRSSRS